MIPESFISDLLERADIVDVVGRYVHLKKSGRNLMACCPFHKEKTPSFAVNPAKQFFKCYGCGKAGSAITFLMAIENLSFPDAVEKLAGIYGLEVPKNESPQAKAAREKARTLLDYMEEAAAFYERSLSGAKRVTDYLKGREITQATAQKFRLGYSPAGWRGLETVFGGKYGAPELLRVGLVNEKNDRRYDAFRDRLMFPIRNPKGRVIGFGARTLNGDEQPKYLNSPETEIYHKGSELYGLFEGQGAIRTKGRAIVCEGYMDVIQLSQAGFEESVAALGTSITPEHVRKLFKLTDQVWFSFDGDAAGRKAARRALEAALPVIADTQKAFFILLPPEHDPDSLIKAEGPEGYEREIRGALTLTLFLKSLLLEGKDLAYAEDRAKIIAEAKPLVLSMANAPVLRLALMGELAGLARIDVSDVERQYGLAPRWPLAKPRPTQGRWRPEDGRWRPETRFEPRAPVTDVRDRMLQCFLAYPELIAEFSPQIEEIFVGSESGAAKRIVEAWSASAGSGDEAEGGRLTPAALLTRLSDSPSIDRMTELLSEELILGTPLEGARLELRRAFLDLELDRAKARLLELGRDPAPDLEGIRRLTGRVRELEKERSEGAEAEKGFRRQMDFERRMESALRTREGARPVVYSDNPKVRALQEHLFGGRGPGSPEAAAAAPEPQRDLREAVEAQAARRAAQRAAAPSFLPDAGSLASLEAEEIPEDPWAGPVSAEDDPFAALDAAFGDGPGEPVASAVSGADEPEGEAWEPEE